MEIIEFNGPFTWGSNGGLPSVLEDPCGVDSGIYLWTVPQAEGELVYYVGETGRSFSIRMMEHLKEHLAGFYHVYDPIAMQRASKVMLWPGRYDIHLKKSLDDIIEAHTHISNAIVATARLYRFYLGKYSSDQRRRKRVEAAIAHHLYKQNEPIGSFQDRGIRYNLRTTLEAPFQIQVGCAAGVLGLPDQIEA